MLKIDRLKAVTRDMPQCAKRLFCTADGRS